MIRNFEEETCNLSDDELKIAQAVMKGLKKYVGKSNAIAGSKICSGFHNNTKFKLQGVRLRKIINHLRNKVNQYVQIQKDIFIQQTIKNFLTLVFQ